MEELRSGTREFTVGDYPKLFYDGDYDSGAILKGFLRSKELVLVSATLLCGCDTYQTDQGLEAHLHHPDFRQERDARVGQQRLGCTVWLQEGDLAVHPVRRYAGK